MSFIEMKEIEQEMARRQVTEPPLGGPCVQRLVDPAAVWERNIESLNAHAFGDPGDPETMLRYWKAQEAAGYPYASENVKYFKSIIIAGKSQKHHKAAWIGTEYDGYADGSPVYDRWECSNCHEEVESEGEAPDYVFCPYCGTEMEEPTPHEDEDDELPAEEMLAQAMQHFNDLTVDEPQEAPTEREEVPEE